jgi:hypothetical protein
MKLIDPDGYEITFISIDELEGEVIETDSLPYGIDDLGMIDWIDSDPDDVY